MSKRSQVRSSRAAAASVPSAADGAARRVSIGFHLLAAGWILAMAGLAIDDPDWYRTLMQEDRVVEWATVWLFLAAGVVGL